MPQEQRYKRLFEAPDADMKPTLVCTGYVFAVGEAHLAKSERYNVLPIDIQPFGGGRAVTLQFLWRPDWFSVNAEGKPSFRPKSLKNVEGGEAMNFVYKKMINNSDKVSALEGLAGNKERLEALEIALMETEGVDGPDSCAVVQGIFEKLVAQDGEDPVEIGYTLRQKRSKGEEKDEAGKFVYTLENGYDFGDFWIVSDKEKTRLRKKAEDIAEKCRAKNEPTNYKICFDEGVTASW